MEGIKVIETCLGSFLGFLLALIIFSIKEHLSVSNRLKSSIVLLRFMVSQLITNLSRDPKVFCPVFDDNMGFVVQGLIVHKDANSLFEEFLTYLSHWKTNNYRKEGDRKECIIKDIEALKKIHDELSCIEISFIKNIFLKRKNHNK